MISEIHRKKFELIGQNDLELFVKNFTKRLLNISYEIYNEAPDDCELHLQENSIVNIKGLKIEKLGLIFGQINTLLNGTSLSEIHKLFEQASIMIGAKLGILKLAEPPACESELNHGKIHGNFLSCFCDETRSHCAPLIALNSALQLKFDEVSNDFGKEISFGILIKNSGKVEVSLFDLANNYPPNPNSNNQDLDFLKNELAKLSADIRSLKKSIIHFCPNLNFLVSKVRMEIKIQKSS